MPSYWPQRKVRYTDTNTSILQFSHSACYVLEVRTSYLLLSRVSEEKLTVCVTNSGNFSQECR